MNKILFVSILSFSATLAFAQAPMKHNAARGTDDTLITTGTYVDTLGAAKQVPNDPSFSSGIRQISTDSTRTRLAQGGKTQKDYAHTKQHAAKKDTTHVHYISTKKVKKSTNRQSANTKKTN